MYKKANEKLKNDLIKNGYNEWEDEEDLSIAEFNEFLVLARIVGIKNAFNKWHFYHIDNIYDNFIIKTEIKQKYPDSYTYDDPYDNDEYLESATNEGIIKGFHYLDGDIYIIGDV